MIGVSGIGGIPEPVGGPRASGKAGAASSPTSAPADDQVEVSSAALNAAKAAASDGTEDVRDERVAEAREQIEAGTYQLQEVVTQVAARLSKFVD